MHVPIDPDGFQLDKFIFLTVIIYSIMIFGHLVHRKLMRNRLAKKGLDFPPRV